MKLNRNIKYKSMYIQSVYKIGFGLPLCSEIYAFEK